MASSVLLLTVSLLILVAAHPCCGQDQDALEQQEMALIEAMRAVSQALECISGTTQEGLRHHSKSTAALMDVMQQLKEQIIQQNGKMDSIKVDTFTQKMMDFEQKLDDKHKTEETLNDYIKDLKNDINTKVVKLQDLEDRLETCQTHSQQSEQQSRQLSNTGQTEETSTCYNPECQQPHLEKVKELVAMFKKNRDWSTLRMNLEAVLDHSSEEYTQLQAVPYGSSERLWLLGRSGFIQLASLLLCAGLPPDTTDSNGYAMLDGAAQGGHLQLAKMLLERGAYVHVRSSNGNTPLSGAAATGELDMVRWLVEAGADTTSQDQHGNTALDWARGRGHTEVVQYLEQLPH